MVLLQTKEDAGSEREEPQSADKIESIRKKLDRQDKWIGKVMDKAKSPTKRSPSKPSKPSVLV